MFSPQDEWEKKWWTRNAREGRQTSTSWKDATSRVRGLQTALLLSKLYSSFSTRRTIWLPEALGQQKELVRQGPTAFAEETVASSFDKKEVVKIYKTDQSTPSPRMPGQSTASHLQVHWKHWTIWAQRSGLQPSLWERSNAGAILEAQKRYFLPYKVHFSAPKSLKILECTESEMQFGDIRFSNWTPLQDVSSKGEALSLFHEIFSETIFLLEKYWIDAEIWSRMRRRNAFLDSVPKNLLRVLLQLDIALFSHMTAFSVPLLMETQTASSKYGQRPITGNKNFSTLFLPKRWTYLWPNVSGAY